MANVNHPQKSSRNTGTFPVSKVGGGGLLVCLSHILHIHEYRSSCPRGSAEGTSLAVDLCRAWLLHASAWIMGSFEKKRPQFSFSGTQGYLLPWFPPRRSGCEELMKWATYPASSLHPAHLAQQVSCRSSGHCDHCLQVQAACAWLLML